MSKLQSDLNSFDFKRKSKSNVKGGLNESGNNLSGFNFNFDILNKEKKQPSTKGKFDIEAFFSNPVSIQQQNTSSR
jgi:hypothetical protein